jgi:serine protease SohB
MIEALIHLGVFCIEAIIIVAAILFALAGILGLASKNKGGEKGKLKVKSLNQRYEAMTDTMQAVCLDKHALKKTAKQQKKTGKNEKKTAKKSKKALKKSLFVLDFSGDIRASAVASLREEITAILLVAQKHDTVLLRLQSPGGSVIGYGLAASELQRLRDADIMLIASVDQVAASGGYMMACVANEIIAAPFSIIGSIGVIAQMPNFNRWLKDKHIDFEQVTAGEYKRSLTMFGENTKADRQKMQADLEAIHSLFKQHVAKFRPTLDLDKVATGEYWLATDAKEHALVDRLMTSDDYLMQQKDQRQLIHVQYRFKKKFGQKMSEGAGLLIDSGLDRVRSQEVAL